MYRPRDFSEVNRLDLIRSELLDRVGSLGHVVSEQGITTEEGKSDTVGD